MNEIGNAWVIIIAGSSGRAILILIWLPAVCKGFCIIMLIILQANAKVGGKTALHSAAAHGHLKVVQALFESGAEIDITDDSGRTPLYYSVEG